MSKRLIVVFICDHCGGEAEVTAVEPFTGKLYSFPKGWGTSDLDKSVDICPLCLSKAWNNSGQQRTAKGIR